MPLGINNPLPSSMKSECKKAANILTSFVNPSALGPDKIIPSNVLHRAKGLAIITVLKAGFLGSARFGSGLVIARLPDGSWSAPSAIATVGGGFGGQIGFELTDFVFILNDDSAVRSFSQAGSVTLGGNVSIAAGPIGRNAEAAGAASLKGVAGVFAYSKTKGLFAGVSLEGSMLVERKDANEKLYNSRVSASQLLSGSIPAPLEANSLLRILNSQNFSNPLAATPRYNDATVYDEAHEDVSWRDAPSSTGTGINRAATWSADARSGLKPGQTPALGNNRQAGGSQSALAKPKPPPIPVKPKFRDVKPALDQAVAKFAFHGEQSGDLSFQKGDVITILKRTNNDADWWTGRIGTREGIFPR